MGRLAGDVRGVVPTLAGIVGVVGHRDGRDGEPGVLDALVVLLQLDVVRARTEALVACS